MFAKLFVRSAGVLGSDAVCVGLTELRGFRDSDVILKR